MFADICFYVKGNFIEVNSQDFLLGELTESCLNISPDEFQRIYENFDKLEQHITEVIPEQTEFENIKAELLKIDKLLRKYKIFQVIGEPVNELFSPFADTINAEHWGDFCYLVSKYRSAINDIYSFNKTIYHFIDKFIMQLKKCDPENYAAAYFDFVNSPLAYKMIVNPIQNDGFIYANTEFLSMNLVPMPKAADSDEYIIAEYYHTPYLQSFLKIDFLKGLMMGHSIRRCEHCKRFFLMTKGYRTRFCDKPSPENPKFTCNQMSYRNFRIKEDNDDNPKYQAYQKCINRIMRSCQRGKITIDEREQLLKKAESLYHTAMTSPTFSNVEFERQLSSKNLYKLCGIEPPKVGRPKAVKDEN